MTFSTRYFGGLPLVLAASSLVLAACADQPSAEDPVEPSDDTPMAEDIAEKDMTDTDPLIWLEEVEGEAALDWVRTQNDRSVAEIQSNPLYQGLYDGALAILDSEERMPVASMRGGYAYNFWRDEQNVRGIWRRMPVTDYVAGSEDWDILLDLDALAEEEGANWVYKGVDCLAPDYERCIITLSPGGSDAAVHREFDIASKSFPEDGFELPESKSSTSWLDADTLLVSAALGGETETESGYGRHVQRWSRGTSIEDAPIIFEGDKADIWSSGMTEYDGDKLIPYIYHGRTFFEGDYYLLGDDGELKKLPFPEKLELSGYLDGRWIAGLNEEWTYQDTTYPSGSVVAYSPDADKAELVYTPEDRVAVTGISVATDRIYVTVLENVIGRIKSFVAADGGWEMTQLDLPDNGVVSINAIEPATGEVLLSYENPVTPSTLYYMGPEADLQAIKSSPAFFDADGIVVNQFEATSTDGTKIPYFVIGQQSVLEAGPAPTVQYGYGGFQIPMRPSHSPLVGKLWLENGGIYVISNIRGGGEFGPEWHQAGLKTKRQIIYDDFFAVAEDLIARNITSPELLGALGGSNGGLLTGVALTQRPDLYSAIGIGVPLLDMLRYDQLLAGASWVGEYGSPSIPEERAFLESISPYHNLDADADYPRPYIFTSTKDDRVHPGHARKMGKKMEEMGHPFLYFENVEGGHGGAANNQQQAKYTSLIYGYFAQELGLGDE